MISKKVEYMKIAAVLCDFHVGGIDVFEGMELEGSC